MPGINITLTDEENKAVARLGADLEGPGTPRDRGRRRAAEIIKMVIAAEFRYDRLVGLMRKEWRATLVEKREAAEREAAKFARLVDLCDEDPSEPGMESSPGALPGPLFPLPDPPRRDHDAQTSAAAGERPYE